MQQIPLAIFLVSVVLLLLATAITSHYPKRGFLRAPSRWIDEEIRIEPHRQGLHHDQDAQSAIKGLTPDADRMASELKEVRERELEVRRRRLELEFEPQLLVARRHTIDYSLLTSIMQIIVSLLVLGAGLYVILSPTYNEEKKWGYGTVGSVIGYWLKR